MNETAILIDKPKRKKPKSVRTPENIFAVSERVREAPSTAIRRCSQQLNILKTSLRRILHKNLSMTPYKDQLVQVLKPIDHSIRFRLAKWGCERYTEYANFDKKKISFSDEAHFDLGGYVNKQNCRTIGAQETLTQTLKSRRTQNESMFGADFSPET